MRDLEDEKRIKEYMEAKMKHIKMYNECMNLVDGLVVQRRPAAHPRGALLRVPEQKRGRIVSELSELRKAAEMALKVLEEINKLSVGEGAVCLPAEG